jgi:hypothetical protein
MQPGGRRMPVLAGLPEIDPDPGGSVRSPYACIVQHVHGMRRLRKRLPARRDYYGVRINRLIIP